MHTWICMNRAHKTQISEVFTAEMAEIYLIERVQRETFVLGEQKIECIAQKIHQNGKKCVVDDQNERIEERDALQGIARQGQAD